MLVKSGGSAQVLVKQQKFCTGGISTTNEIVLAKFGRFPLQIHFWQQILRYHHRTVALDNTCLLKLAMLSGYTSSDDQAITATVNKSWHFHLGCFAEHCTRQQQLMRFFDIGFFKGKALGCIQVFPR